MPADDTPGHRRKIAVLGPVAPDMRAGLADDYDLLDAAGVAALGPGARAAITHGISNAMAGAKVADVAHLPGLTTIVSLGAGMDAYDVPGLAARDVIVEATGSVMTEDTAEAAVALTFALLRRVVSNDGFVRQGDWSRGRAPMGWRVSGRKVGIVGLGRIGSRVAEKLSALGCDVAYTGRSAKDVVWRFEPDLMALARSVDVLILCCVGGDATRGIINEAVLRELGAQGFVVNVSRGSVVVEEDLLDALERGVIAGAALDVFENEPNPDRRFLEVPNCILQPHAAVFTHENRSDLLAELKRLFTEYR
ncbi:MAG: NAD(P)-dependent oxidoreductase [Roseicyclus sp.]